MREKTLQYVAADIRYVENTIDFECFSDLVGELAPDFVTVRVTRSWAGPMATPLFGDIAVVFAVGAAAGAFLGELGKDAYRGVRAALYSIYRSVKREANDRGAYTPLAIEETREGGDRGVISLIFPPDLDEAEFNAALATIGPALEKARAMDARLIGMTYRVGKGWVAEIEM